MPQPLSLARAAKLAGVKRSDLQNKLRESGLDIFEGKIAVADLLRVYPNLDLERDPVFERIQKIRRDARPKRDYTDGWVPEPEVLLSRLKDFENALLHTKALLNRSEAIINEFTERLKSLVESDEEHAKAQAEQLLNWISDHSLETIKEPDVRARIYARDNFYHIFAAKIKVKPSGHEYLLEGRESLLEAGIKAGLHLDYGCASGNCGKCKCKVVSGKVSSIKKHDYYLSQREIDDGYVLACSTTAVSDLVIEAHEAQNTSDLPLQEIKAAVTDVESLSQDGVMLRLKTPKSKMLRFMSGQSVRLTNEDGEQAVYPLTSCACDGRNLEFLICRDESDFSRTLFSRDITGEAVIIEGPLGDFTLIEQLSTNFVFIGAKEGIGAVISMIEQAISVDQVDNIYFYLIDEPAWGDKFENLYRSWKDALDNFHMRRFPPETGHSMITSCVLEDNSDQSDCGVYIAGKSDFVDSVRSELQDSFNDEHILVLKTDQAK